ncbi:UNVERIFIED_CONTAM: hypothetical protein NCL1_38858 [Trichonephila clavipes]
MAAKRGFIQDPEYDEVPASLQEKRIRLIEDNGRMETKNKIESIITANISQEISFKSSEIESVDEVST